MATTPTPAQQLFQEARSKSATVARPATLAREMSLTMAPSPSTARTPSPTRTISAALAILPNQAQAHSHSVARTPTREPRQSTPAPWPPAERIKSPIPPLSPSIPEAHFPWVDQKPSAQSRAREISTSTPTPSPLAATIHRPPSVVSSRAQVVL